MLVSDPGTNPLSYEMAGARHKGVSGASMKDPADCPPQGRLSSPSRLHAARREPGPPPLSSGRPTRGAGAPHSSRDNGGVGWLLGLLAVASVVVLGLASVRKLSGDTVRRPMPRVVTRPASEADPSDHFSVWISKVDGSERKLILSDPKRQMSHTRVSPDLAGC